MLPLNKDPREVRWEASMRYRKGNYQPARNSSELPIVLLGTVGSCSWLQAGFVRRDHRFGLVGCKLGALPLGVHVMPGGYFAESFLQGQA